MSLLPRIGVIIIHYSGVELTRKCLQHVSQLVGATPMVALVDNSDSADAPSPPENLIAKVIRIENKGFSHANNAGFQWFKDQSVDAVWLLNNDAFPEPSSLENLISDSQALTSNFPVAAGSMLLNEDGSIQARGGVWFPEKGTGLQVVSGHPEQGIPYPAGAVLLLNRSALDSLDWKMDDRYFLYFEELDLVLRLSKLDGFKVIWSESSKVIHLEGASAGSGHAHHDRSVFSEYHFHRSKRLFYEKNFPELVGKMKFLQVLVVLKRLMKGDKNRAVAAWRGFFKKSMG
jgi:N-acetylglucosaminyl-diphospho-decaprenol L-rhamnosyltransferase